MSDGPLTGPIVKTVHRPRGVILWLLISITAFFFAFGSLPAFLAFSSPDPAACVLGALFFFSPGVFFLLTVIGFRSQHLTLSGEAISFALPVLGSNTVLPWTLRRHRLPWSAVRAVDVKLRNLGGDQRVFVLRTTAGDFVFFWPQWPDADAISGEIIRRSGASTGIEDMAAPPVLDPLHPEAAVPGSTGERFMRGCGFTMLVVAAILLLLCVAALFGVAPEERGNIGKAILFLGFAAAGANQLRRYRRIR